MKLAELYDKHYMYICRKRYMENVSLIFEHRSSISSSFVSVSVPRNIMTPKYDLWQGVRVNTKM